MNKWIAEFELEDGDIMPEHMDLNYKGAKIDFYCKPLEQEPTTKNDLGVDAVSRQAAIDAIRRIHPIDTDYDCTLYDKVDVMYVLNDLPSVTLKEPKTGKWISTETKGVRYAFWCRYKCPLCGGLSAHTNFCPNCGADMRGEE